ncbi:MAG: hypothetical protein ABIP94_01025 [Planctomycetota bacterium]
MKSLIVKAVIGLVLFVGSLVGALAATGRLNHAGTAGIPLLSSLFPEPPKVEGAEGEAKPEAPEGPEGRAAEASHSGEAVPQDASHGAKAEPEGTQGPQEPQADAGARKAKVGRSLVEAEVKPGGDGHGSGHGEPEAAAGGHGAEKEDKKDDKKAKKSEAHGAAPAGDQASNQPQAVADFNNLQQALAGGKSKYTPGDYFKFDGMPAGLTADQLNEAWQRVQGVQADIERRKTALDLREQELQELADDIARRQHELGRERTEIENEHRRLDARLQKFQEQVKLVRSDEAAALKRNAQTMASFEPEKAAELVLSQWSSERGQDEILRLLEFMDKDAVNELLKALPTQTVQDIMKKRLRVSKEAAPSK